MARKKHAHHKLAKPPGFLLYTGENVDAKFSLDVMQINHDSNLLEEKQKPLEYLHQLDLNKRTTWINVNGLADVSKIAEIGKLFAIHPLTQEDIVNVNSRPNFDEYPDYLFIEMKMLYYKEQKLVVEHLSFLLKENLLLSFQEIPEDVLEPVRVRIREGKGRIRTAGADYLLYALVDAVVDHYFLVFETFGDKIEDLENKIFENPDDEISLEIQGLKREVYKIRKALFPMREMINRLERTENALIQKETKMFIRDVHNHAIQLIETVENYRDMTMGLMDLYMTSISNKMNNVMKVLTIIATIFIPLTFIAGVYGMNFEYMPELKYKYSYFILWGVMVLTFAVMLLLFKRRKWL
jgi:magnesium transporter